MLNKKALSALSVTADPNFKNVTLLLHGDGTNGAQNNTFIDSSTNNFTITRNGNTTQGSLSPFGDRWSNYFDGISDYLYRSGNSTALRPGSGNFTIEFWYNSAGLTQKSYGVFYEFYDPNARQTISIQYDGTGANLIYVEGGSIKLTTSGVDVRDGAWHHNAIVRNGSTVTYYVDGVNRGTYSTTLNVTTGDSFIIGNYSNGNYEIAGYMSNLRVVVGSAVYTSNFTPPTEPLTAISGTALLTCQSNRFIDNSSNNFTITRYGDVSVQPFSPFAPSAAYSTSVNGGSGYWAGTTELAGLTLGNSLLGSSDFCIEFWVYIPDLSTSGGTATIMPLVSNYDWYAGATNASIFIAYDSGQFWFYLYTGAGTNVSSAPNSSVSTGASSAVLGMWHHIACTRSGATIKIYQNGVEKSSATLSSNTAVNLNTRDIYIGRNYLNAAGSPTASRYLKGYISSFRMVVGSSVYTGNFTPPVAPLTAIANTSRLLNFTNAGIVDSAADNVLETVGNAQISTSVKKYGTGSLAFDGTGDYLTVPASQNVNFGTGNFTVEFWLYATSNPAYVTIIDNNYSVAPNFTVQPASGTMMLFLNGSSVYLTDSTGAVTTGTWNHFAFVRNGTTVTMYRNGNSVASTTYSGNVGNASVPYFIGGSLGGGGYYLNGYIDDLRITKGVARYTANFTPPAAPFPNQ